MSETPEIVPGFSLSRRSLQIVMAGVVGVGIVGFFIGARPSPVTRSPAAPESGPVGPVSPAVGYEGLREGRRGVNAQWRSSLGGEGAQGAALPPGPERDAALLEALAERAERRAYEGAPPRVPHPVDQGGALACLACHREGAQVNGKVASKMSHAWMGQCTQCHVPESPPGPFGEGESVDLSAGNTFVGAGGVGGGERAWPGAPPWMPHSTHMREDCASCHGPLGRAGLRTTHPERQSCVQCHASSAALDQRGPVVPFP